MMFDGLLSKFKKGARKEVPAIKKPVVHGEEGKSGNALMFASIGLIVLGIAAIAFEYVTTADVPVVQPNVPRPAIKTALPAKPASAPASTTTVAASAPKAVSK